MTYNSPEYSQVELTAIEQLQVLGYTYIEGSQLSPDHENKERVSYRDVVLVNRLRSALQRINPEISSENISKVVYDLIHVSAVSLIEANQTIWEMLVRYISVDQDMGKGRKGQTVKIIDFDNIENNEFLVTNQFKVQGHSENIIPDIIIFINGLPIAVIECKSPTITDPIAEGIEQILRYSNRRFPESHEGAEKLFWYNQLNVVTCGDDARIASVSAMYEHYLSWKDPYPFSVKDISEQPNLQQVLLKGVFDRRNLLDIIKNFIIFEKSNNKTIKKVCRYQQFRAVHKTIERLKTEEKKKDRSGVIWHTQGSGKSLTMVFLAGKIRRDPELKSYKLVFLLDRTQLETQLKTTFTNCGDETIYRARNSNHFKELLKTDHSDLIIGMIHKFGKDGFSTTEEINPSEKILVFIDEAHRTQYGTLGTSLNLALPNAPKIAFTGTPLIKTQQTTNEFGSYIDRYTIEQAVEDGATVRIMYEGRESNTKVTGDSLDKLFDIYFEDKSPEVKDKIKQTYGKELAVLEAPKRIEMICAGILQHYRTKIQPNGFKAQIVTASRRAAVLYKNTLDALNAPESAVIISGKHNDDPFYKDYTDESKHKELIDRFKKPMEKDQLSILIVKDMLITGFDAPVEQVMYLDRKLTDHTLLQAVARVNRTAENKKCGYIVDYYGLSDYLHDALKDFSSNDVKGALIPIKEELPRLEKRHFIVMQYFKGIDRKNKEACIQILENEEKRQNFMSDFKKFLSSMEIIMPDKAAAPYIPDMKWLGEIAIRARNRYRDPMLEVKGCGEKVRKLINDHVYSSGIDVKVPPIDLLSPNFKKHIDSIKSKRAQASEIEHAIKHHITIHLQEDPEYYSSLSERLKQIIDKLHENWEQMVLELFDFKESMELNRGNEAQSLGLSTTEFAFYNIIVSETTPKNSVKELTIPQKKEYAEITTLVVNILKEATLIVDFFNKEYELKKVRRDIKRLFQETSFSDLIADNKHLIDRIVDLSKKHFNG